MVIKPIRCLKSPLGNFEGIDDKYFNNRIEREAPCALWNNLGLAPGLDWLMSQALPILLAEQRRATTSMHVHLRLMRGCRGWLMDRKRSRRGR